MIGYNSLNNNIPLNYKCNCQKIQLELLTGIIDAIGIVHLPQNLIKIKKNKNTQQIKDILFLSRSLGFKTYQTKSNIFISLQVEYENKYDFVVEKLEIDDYYGFEIDGNHRFVLGDFTVTHNTVMALKIISEIERKTLIIVHKEFLMNQWIERISEFIPTARVGKIQGPKFDIEDKDIVIGMIQSMYDRAFPSNAFTSFGLTIIDEVHRIGSEEFSKTLFKTITNCMLGISATVDRKDGLTNILHMFIGPKIYSEERKDEDIIEVRAIEYIHKDPEYNEIVYDYMGNVAHSTMISKISNFPPRCDFVVNVLKDLIKENPEKQIMVLSQIRGLLTDIHTKLSESNCDVGFYVGGMKQKDLQETEERQIVLATYAMAAEALDIKTLNTLVMVSPKTDIIQSVGRILRTRGLGKLIVDIIDTHDVFQNQWKKRRTYYKKCGYGISYIKSNEYVDMNMQDRWKRISNATVVTADDEKPKCLIDISKMNF
jgi:superfamily II DNA or RNA helicase